MLGTPHRLLGLVALVGACAKTPEPPPPPAPSVAITAPEKGGTTGPRVVVRLTATGVRVVPASGARVPGEGHHHLFLDADPGPPESVIGKGGGIFHLGSGVDSLVLDSLAAGPHRLISVFAGGDHVPMVEVRADTVQFEVKRP
ncbi:MAG: DUF4399 domain-containing protein [Gemmatimonadales bacterium]